MTVITLHNAPGDHPMGRKLTGDDAIRATPKISGEAVHDYTSDGYAQNDLLRGFHEDVDPELIPGLKDSILNLDDAIYSQPALTENIMVYRGISNVDGVLGSGFESRVGRHFTERGYTSTSPDRATAESFMSAEGQARDGALIRVTVPHGRRAVTVSDSGEREILIPRNTTFQTTGERNVRGQFTEIDMEVAS